MAQKGKAESGTKTLTKSTGLGNFGECANIERITALLKKCVIFSNLGKGELTELASRAILLHFKEGETIISEGYKSAYYYLILNGRVKIFMNSLSGKEFIIDIRCSGETFGDLASLDRKLHFATSQTIVDTEIIAINIDDLHLFIKKYPIIEKNIICVSEERLRNSYSKLISLVAETVEQRLITLLLLLSTKYGKNLAFNHKEIAEMIGSTNETSTRILTQLKNLGILRSTRGKIIILNEDLLRSLIH